MTQLNDEDRTVLEMAGRRYRYAGAQEKAVRDELGISMTGYLQKLNRLIDDPAAALEYPMLVARLRRVRAERLRQRVARAS